MRFMLLPNPRLLFTLIVFLFPIIALSQTSNRDRDVAAAFAPVFYQALGDKPRSDYLTNFDFDGDWRGDNNWQNAEDKKFPLKAYVYYSVAETATHYFIHYAVFHPRDYKGGERKGRILSELIREGVKNSKQRDPTGWLDEAGVAHENDMEGCLVVVTKNGSDLERARLTYVETLHHNDFSRYMAGEAATKGIGLIKSEGNHPLLYIEPKGHGIEAYTGDEKQTEGKEFVVYKFAAKAEDPEQQRSEPVGYELIPIQTTLWARAGMKSSKQTNTTFGNFHDYGQLIIKIVQPNGKIVARKISLGKRGSAFRGETGGLNMARPPWGWFDKNTRNQPLGLWFFDPAPIIKRDFQAGEAFSVAYVRLPFWATGK